MNLLNDLKLVTVRKSHLPNRDWLEIKASEAHIAILEPEPACNCDIVALYIDGPIDVYNQIATLGLHTAALRAQGMKAEFLRRQME